MAANHIFSDATSPSPANDGSRWRQALPAVLAAALAMAIYAVTIGGTFVYDDAILHEDPRFTHPALWAQFWTRAYMPGAVDQLYRPLTSLSFAVQFSLHGDRAWVFHLVNILLHAGVSACVAELARRMMGFRAALVAGILFAVHPVHVEAVAGLVGRAELLCALASLGALILFLRPLTFARGMCICLCLAIAILTKEQGILLPAFLLALVPYRNAMHHSVLQVPNRLSTSDKTESKRGATGGLFAVVCLIAAGYIIFREQLLGFGWDRQSLEWTMNPMIRSTGAQRVWMPFVLLGRYLLLLVAPLKLSLDYGTHVIGWTVDWRQPFVYLGLATFITATVALLVSAWRKNWAVVFCLIGLGLSYGMISNSVVIIGVIFAERLMYLPSAFFLTLVAVLLSRYFRPAALLPLVLVLAVLASVRSFTYARLWNHPLQLCLTDLADHPESMHLHSLVVDQYLADGDYRAAREVAEDCRRRLPECWESYRLCLAADVRLHDYADAEQVLRHVDPRCPGLKIMILRDDLHAEQLKYEQNGARDQK